MRTTSYLAGGALALFLAMATPGFALDTDIYLSVRTTVPVVEQTDSVLGLQADASATAQSSQEDDGGQSSSSVDASAYAVSSSSLGFLEKLFAWFSSLGFSSSSNLETNQTTEDLHVTNVSTHSAVVVLPEALSSSGVVYYGTTSPVVIASSTLHASPWRFWRRNEVAIHGLIPDTMYFYKVIGNGTTTAEASFRTRTQ